MFLQIGIRDYISDSITQSAHRWLGLDIRRVSAPSWQTKTAKAESVILARREFLCAESPRLIGITAVHGNDLPCWIIIAVVETGHGIKRRVETCGAGQHFQLSDVIGPFGLAAGIVLVLQLNGDNRAAIVPQQPFHLLADLSVIAGHIMQIGGIVAANSSGSHDPIGQSAQAGLAVRPGTDAQQHPEAIFAGQSDGMAQVAVPAPIEMPLMWLDMVPKDEGRDDVNARRFHLRQLFVPILMCET